MKQNVQYLSGSCCLSFDLFALFFCINKDTVLSVEASTQENTVLIKVNHKKNVLHWEQVLCKIMHDLLCSDDYQVM